MRRRESDRNHTHPLCSTLGKDGGNLLVEQIQLVLLAIDDDNVLGDLRLECRALLLLREMSNVSSARTVAPFPAAPS